MQTKATILGPGRMGGAMARRLRGQGFELTLWNRTGDAQLDMSAIARSHRR
jgi:3-hydroxyisobutyrate dehydrogenase-like beta-hydroxyacid dehydrogenase